MLTTMMTITKYLTKFATEQAYENAKYTLDYPNTSLVNHRTVMVNEMPTPPEEEDEKSE